MLKKSVNFATVLIVTALMFSCSDNDGRRPRMSPQEQAGLLKEALDLTDQQVEQVTKIYTDMQEEISKLREKSGGDRGAMREAMRDLRDETDARINELLTDEQKEKYQTFQQERRERMRDRFERRESRE